MFNRNDPVMPEFEFKPDGTCKEYPGLTKFEQCAKDFTAAWIQALSHHAELFTWKEMSKKTVEFGILAAEEFCKQMEEREK